MPGEKTIQQVSGKVKSWCPRLAKTDPVDAEEVIELLVATTNQTRGSLLAILSELDVILERSLKTGRTVKLPNGTTFRPVGKKDGSLSIKTRFSTRMSKAISIGQSARWINADNIGKTEDEMIVIWNELHPDDPIEV